MNKYFCSIIFHFRSTLQFNLMLENELFAFTLFLMGINDFVLNQIGFLALCWNELWSITDIALYIKQYIYQYMYYIIYVYVLYMYINICIQYNIYETIYINICQLAMANSMH